METDTLLPADGTASAEAALRCLHPEDNGQFVNLSSHAGLPPYIELTALRQSMADKEKRETALKQMLQDMDMAEALQQASELDAQRQAAGFTDARVSSIQDLETQRSMRR